jgi:hypothetical protein
MACECLYLGCISSCADFDTGIEVESDGVYTVILRSVVGRQTFSLTLTAGESIQLPVSQLNECAHFTMWVQNEADAFVVVAVDGVDYDCFNFRTEIITEISVDVEATLQDDCSGLA